MANHRFILRRSELGQNYVAFPQMGSMKKNAAITYFANKLDKSVAKVQSVLNSFGKAISNASTEFGLTASAGKFGTSGVSVLGGFAGHNGPWVFGKNFLEIILRASLALRNIFEGIIPTLVNTDVVPTVKTVYNETADEYNQLRLGDVIALTGDDLAPDLDTTDEGVIVMFHDADNPVKWYGMQAQVTVPELQVVKFKVLSAPSGHNLGNDVKIRVKTRCGFGADYPLKTVDKTIEFVREV